MSDQRELTNRQLDILQFLELVGPSEEGDVALCIEIRPHELLLVPPSFTDIPVEYITRKALERLQEAGLVTFDGIVWEITSRGARHLSY
ncbi:MAG: hypothetical protein C4575_04010 [Desulforudis sp.]|jgi:hypothetical protein|nr:hypothetical protein [Clostridia bacterium]MDQ7791640.1 hypothetical protein [Clostridia bacterium]RJX21372.1 MAG: hypothetical protein C4575_04010 [Desulforudis sp.]